jgi:hypothetical protein
MNAWVTKMGQAPAWDGFRVCNSSFNKAAMKVKSRRKGHSFILRISLGILHSSPSLPAMKKGVADIP